MQNRTMRKIGKFAMSLLLLIGGGLSIATVQAQDLMNVHFTVADTSACDENKLVLPIKLENYPGGYNWLILNFLKDDGSIQTLPYSLAELAHKGYVFTETFGGGANSRYHYDSNTGFADYTEEIQSAYLSNSRDVPERKIEVSEPRKILWHIYGTPQTPPTDAASDPSYVKIENKSSNCGWDLTLNANTSWQGVSTYEWSSSSVNFTFGEDGATTGTGVSVPLKQVRFSGSKGASQAMKTTITLTQTVGMMCKASHSKEITMLGWPDGTIASVDENGVPQSVYMCSSVGVDEDPSRIFSGTLTMAGEAPFTATLSTGDVYSNLGNGVNAFEQATANKAGAVIIEKLVDRNGCEAPEGLNLKSGYVTVIDRKPQPYFRNDTIMSASRDITLEVEASSTSHQFEWGVRPESEDFDTQIVGGGSTAQVKSNMNGVISYYVVETDIDGQRVDCFSDVTVQTVRFEMPLRYPNAISPNGDGKNDKLVIEGLPEENRIMVVDDRGKVVYEKENYRNDWDAEGVGDGYYVYVFKGKGTKTVKETLAIRRAAK